MPLHHFEDLEIWKRSSRLAVDVLRMIEGLRKSLVAPGVINRLLSIFL